MIRKQIISLKSVFYKCLYFSLTALFLSSCSYDGRLVSKFIKRVNAKEVNAASKYVYPADHASLYFFNAEVLEKTPNLILEVIDKANVMVDGHKGVAVRIQCTNVSQFFVNYMKELNLLNENNIISDTIIIKKTDDGDKITFRWSKIYGENLYLGSIDENQPENTTLNIHSSQNKESKVIGSITFNKKVVVDQYSEEPNWLQCYTIDNTGNIVHGYIFKSPILIQDTLFFSLGIFEGLSFLLAFIILVVIAFPIMYLGSIIQAVISMGAGGLVASVALVLGLIYTVYQLLENILFELFLINLPY